MADQWPRAHLRAALREVGYDAIGTRTLSGALAYSAQARGRGPVRAIVVDATVVDAARGDVGGHDPLVALLDRHGAIPLVLLASAVRADPSGQWARVIRRPFSVQDAVTAVSDLIPLPAEQRNPVDVDS